MDKGLCLLLKRLATWLWVLFPVLLFSQSTFTADTDAKIVPIGGSFEVKFTLSSAPAPGAGFTPPSFADFARASGTNHMQGMSMVNGATTNFETYSFVLTAKKEGRFTIAPAMVRVKGKLYQTNPLTIEVVKAKPAPVSPPVGDLKGKAKDVVFIRAEVNRHDARIGQQIVLEYKLYTRASLNGVNLVKEPDYPGFYKQEILSFNHGEENVTIGGKRYIAKVLSRVALFPLQEGELTIDPLTIQVGAVKNQTSKSDDPLDDFFNMPTVQTLTVTSNPVIVAVKALPDKAPASFTGAVGAYEIADSISRTEGTTDDVVSLKMTVKGNGDPKRIQAPKLTPIDGLEYYDPKITSEHSEENQGEIVTTKEIEYLIVPKKPGKYSLRPEFTYFNELEGAYATLAPNVYNLTITQGKATSASPITTTLHIGLGGIRYIKTETVLERKGEVFLESPTFWSLAIAPFLLVFGVAGYKQFQKQLSRRDLLTLKSRDASKVAQRRLLSAREYLKTNQPKAFYDEVSKAMFGYVADKLHIPLADFSKSSVQEKLQSLRVSDEGVKDYNGVLQSCEIALFAGKDNEGSMNDVYQKALKVITQIENELKIVSRKII